MAMTGVEKLGRYPGAMQMIEDGTASRQTVEAAALLAGGFVLREIAEELGVKTSRAQAVLSDPTGQREEERKHRVYGTCADCGGKTFNGGSRNCPERCAVCAPKHRRQTTEREIIAAIHDWHRRYGRQPTSMDWNVSLARVKAHPERLAQIEAAHEERDWPWVPTTQAVFGSWNDAIRAAGFEPLSVGQRLDPATWRRHLGGKRAV